MQVSSFSKRLYEQTSAIHRQVETSPFVKQLSSRQLSKESYSQYLVDLFPIYEFLESQMKERSFESIYYKDLCRADAINEDIHAFQAEKLTPSQASQKYLSHLIALATTEPLMLLAHAYVRYLGDLSGGFIIKNMVLKIFPNASVKFYNFDTLLAGKNAETFKKEWKEKLDQLPLTQDQQARFIEEARKAYEFAGEMFEAATSAP